MSQSGWYHDRAAESNRMALASKSASARDRHIKDRENRREIAARIDVAEEAVKQRKRKEQGPLIAPTLNVVAEVLEKIANDLILPSRDSVHLKDTVDDTSTAKASRPK